LTSSERWTGCLCSAAHVGDCWLMLALHQGGLLAVAPDWSNGKLNSG
jgi:hypothetical protein